MTSTDPSVPYGYCHCGCGGRTKVADYTNRPRGVIRGEPLRFIKGHNARLSSSPYLVDEATGCWEWQRALSNGYGHLSVEGRHALAHRWMYEQKVGPIPAGLHLDHLCRNKRCVNPDHLDPVTLAENSRRGNAARLSAKDAEAIRAATGLQRDIAAQYGVHQSVISKIKSGTRWAKDPS